MQLVKIRIKSVLLLQCFVCAMAETAFWICLKCWFVCWVKPNVEFGGIFLDFLPVCCLTFVRISEHFPVNLRLKPIRSTAVEIKHFTPYEAKWLVPVCTASDALLSFHFAVSVCLGFVAFMQKLDMWAGLCGFANVIQKAWA